MQYVLELWREIQGSDATYQSQNILDPDLLMFQLYWNSVSLLDLPNHKCTIALQKIRQYFTFDLIFGNMSSEMKLK